MASSKIKSKGKKGNTSTKPVITKAIAKKLKGAASDAMDLIYAARGVCNTVSDGHADRGYCDDEYNCLVAASKVLDQALKILEPMWDDAEYYLTSADSQGETAGAA